MVEETYPSHNAMSTKPSGTLHCGASQQANDTLSRKNGDQQKTKVKNTTPKTLVAFCSVRTAFAATASFWRLFRFARNLRRDGNEGVEFELIRCRKN